jgi:hypothetical protein
LTTRIRLWYTPFTKIIAYSLLFSVWILVSTSLNGPWMDPGLPAIIDGGSIKAPAAATMQWVHEDPNAGLCSWRPAKTPKALDTYFRELRSESTLPGNFLFCDWNQPGIQHDPDRFQNQLQVIGHWSRPPPAV